MGTCRRENIYIYNEIIQPNLQSCPPRQLFYHRHPTNYRSMTAQ